MLNQSLGHGILSARMLLVSVVSGDFETILRGLANPVTETRKYKRALFRLETGLFLAGGLLLVAFFSIRGWSSFQSEAAISAFEEARASTVQPTTHTLIIETPEQEVAAFEFEVTPVDLSLTSTDPDYSLWSEKRIDEYRKSLLVNDDKPKALLSIDHLNIKVPVFNGTDDLNLNRGVGRILGTGRIDEVGNLGIAGHRDGFFRGLKDIQIGDTFELQTLTTTTQYTVTSITIVDPSDVSVLKPTEVPTITLVTCYPFYFIGSAPKRYIVKGEAGTTTVRT